MENTEILSDDPEFLEWLHALTLVGYDNKIILHLDHGKEIIGYYNNGLPPLDAIEAYKEYLIETGQKTRESTLATFWAARKKPADLFNNTDL